MPAGDIMGAALSRTDLSPKARAFLLDIQRQCERKPTSARQMEAVERIASAPPRPDFASVNSAALTRLPDVLTRLLPGGRAVGAEWHAGSLRGETGDSLRVRMRGHRAGAWADFATGDKGGDVVSLAAAVAGLTQADAAVRLARMLGMEGAHHG
jgi:hypothetical protein